MEECLPTMQKLPVLWSLGPRMSRASNSLPSWNAQVDGFRRPSRTSIVGHQPPLKTSTGLRSGGRHRCHPFLPTAPRARSLTTEAPMTTTRFSLLDSCIKVTPNEKLWRPKFDAEAMATSEGRTKLRQILTERPLSHPRFGSSGRTKPPSNLEFGIASSCGARW